MRDLLDFQGPVCLADGREAGRKGAQIGVTGRTKAPTPGCPEFPWGLIQAYGSLREKEDGMFPRRHWHLQFLLGRFGIFWPQFLKYSQFYSRLLLSTYCYFAAGREYIGGH